MLWIPHQLVGAPLAYNVTLECHTEAYPTSLNYWTRDDGHMIHESTKYHMENTVGAPAYKTHMNLLIRSIDHEDYGTYKCVAKNPRGESDGTIRLYSEWIVPHNVNYAKKLVHYFKSITVSKDLPWFEVVRAQLFWFCVVGLYMDMIIIHTQCLYVWCIRSKKSLNWFWQSLMFCG